MNNRTLIAIFSCLCFIIAGSPAYSGEFRVTPIRLELDKNAKSGVFSVMNEGNTDISLQVSAREWTQDESGKDVYTETQDIVFFPKIMTLKAGEERVIRVGMKGQPPNREKTYRLFIEEIPEPRKAEGARVNIAIRFAPPIFVRPVSVVSDAAVESVSLSHGRLTAVIKNMGNIHITISSVLIKGADAAGKEMFSKEIAGWHLLSGASRAYSADIPADICRKLSSIDIEVKTDTISIHGKKNVQQEMCSP